MHWRLALGVTAAAGIALATTGLLATQTTRPPERTWMLLRENQRNSTGTDGYLRSHWKASVVYKEQYKKTNAGYEDWVAGPARVVWMARLEEGSFDMVGVRESSTPGGMGTRARVDTTTTCGGGGTVILEGPGLVAEDLPKFRMPCTSTMRWRDGGGTSTAHSSRRLVVPPEPMSETYLTNCRYRESRSSRESNRYEVETLTASLSPGDISATFEFASPADKAFVPEPGRVVRVVGKSAEPVLWAFELDPVSKLRGYATNADVDKAFFEIFDLPFLWNVYGTRHPDLIFDPRTYERSTGTNQFWKPAAPGPTGNEWGRIESRERITTADVQVTAMDYGAHGAIRAYVKPSCGDWVEVGSPLPLPVDDDDNAIADAIPAYASLPATSDEDAQPRGDGVNGDGLTAFEEYRGFVVPNSKACRPTAIDHERTSPAQKDLFISVTDPVLLMPATTFATVSGLAVHRICPAQYAGDNVKMINFTMHLDPGSGAHGRKLTQEWPQHGLRLVNEPLRDGRFATAGVTGPPGQVDRVRIDVQQILEGYRNDGPFLMLTGITWHELGHAVSIKHHGDGNLWGPFVLLDVSHCFAQMTEGTVDGRPACLGTSLVKRHGQNSGQATCPMKYVDWDWYVPEGGGFTRSGEVTFNPNRGWPWARVRRLPAFSGPVAPYQKNDDHMGMTAFCTVSTGSGVNDPARGPGNHAGDAADGRGICAHKLHVNDVR